MASSLQQDSTGVSFVTTVTDQAGDVVNLGDATSIQFIFERPDGVVQAFSGTLVSDGSDGKAKYVLQDGDLSLPGSWRYQTRISWGTTTVIYSSISKFKVLANIE